MRWGMIKIKGDLCSKFTSMQRKRSCYIDYCQGAFHVLKIFGQLCFLAFRVQTNEKHFLTNVKIFVS